MPAVNRGRSQRRVQPLPRRVPSEEAKERYKREVLGYPKPLDVWIATSINACSSGSSVHPLGPEQARCTLQKICHVAPNNGTGFTDPDRHVLYLTVSTPSGVQGYGALSEMPRRLVLDTYVGWPESLDAPDWTKWAAGQTVTFVQPRAAVVDIIHRVQGPTSVTSLVEAMGAVQISHEEESEARNRVRRRPPPRPHRSIGRW